MNSNKDLSKSSGTKFLKSLTNLMDSVNGTNLNLSSPNNLRIMTFLKSRMNLKYSLFVLLFLFLNLQQSFNFFSISSSSPSNEYNLRCSSVISSKFFSGLFCLRSLKYTSMIYFTLNYKFAAPIFTIDLSRHMYLQY